MAYVTKAEHNMARSRRHLQLASEGLASARRIGDKALIRAFEQHVMRHLSYCHNAQEAVRRERKQRVYVRLWDAIPYTLDGVSA